MKNLLSKVPSTRFLKYSLITVVLFVFGSSVLYVANDYRLKGKYERGLNQIQVGDSRQSVVALMGEPNERYWCYPLPTNHDTPERKRFHERCVEEYWYVTFLKPYIVTFDKNDQVSGTNYMISQ
jgi:hypothetical protein